MFYAMIFGESRRRDHYDESQKVCKTVLYAAGSLHEMG